jgi:hypothetical protein
MESLPKQAGDTFCVINVLIASNDMEMCDPNDPLM